MNPTVILNSIIYATLGIIIFCAGFLLVDKLTPYNLWHELTEKKNVALAIVIGCGALGTCIIIAAAIH